jgi:hypothetical protein
MVTAEFYYVDYDSDGNLVIEQISRNTNWRDSWDIILSGNFSAETRDASQGGGFSDLLFYDRSTGEIEIYKMDGAGHLDRLVRRHTMRRSWDIIIPGNWGGPSAYTDLLCYDRSAGLLEFYASDGEGSLELLRSLNNQRRSLEKGSSITSIIIKSYS